ncbi:hypothetical protein JTB14_000426 [Gonioctena quinquepunctata]|nr:hypothetical protein JTB14_000426 [Gonioctena quinquepunctata]
MFRSSRALFYKMDHTITQGYENGGEIIAHNISQHTDNYGDMNKQGYSNVQSSETPNYGQDNSTMNPHIQAVDTQEGGVQENNAPEYIEPPAASSMPVIAYEKVNESLDSLPGEPYFPIDPKEQINPVESPKSADVIEQQSDNAYIPKKSQHQQSYEVVDDPNHSFTVSGASKELTEESNENQNVSTEQYAEGSENNFVSQYESETVQITDNPDCENKAGNIQSTSQDSEMEYENDCDNLRVEEQSSSGEIATDVVEGENSYIATEITEPIQEISDVQEETALTDKMIELNTDNIITESDSQTDMEVEEESIAVETSEAKDADSTPDPVKMESSEVVTEVQGDYTIVEGPHSVQISATEIIQEDPDIEEVPEEVDHPAEEITQMEQPQSEVVQATPSKGRKIRRANEIPMHLLGVDISKPVEQIPNGRQMPKARLGVKVPYRNLTSQIISKEELEKEIIDRSRAKEEANSKNDLKFARSLTQRLASKIAPAPEKSYRNQKKSIEAPIEQTPPGEVETVTVVDIPDLEESFELEGQSNQVENPGVSVDGNQQAVVDNSKIQNNDDLLAILEGEGEEMPVLPKEVPEVSEIDNSNLKMIEREIALQQLQELPHQIAKPRIFKSRNAKTGSAPILSPQVPSKPEKAEKTTSQTPQKQLRIERTSSANQKVSQNTSANSKTPEKSSIQVKLYASPSPMKNVNMIDSSSPKKQPIEVEPQVKVNMVLKTYSRKRKISEIPEMDIPSPKRPVFEDPDVNKSEKNDPLALPTDVYVTKSSRIIKKKVIWDPDDELPAKSPKPAKPSETKAKETEKTPEVADKKSAGERVAIRKLSSDSKGSDKKLSADKVTKKIIIERVVVAKSVEKKTVEKVSPKKTPQDKVKSQILKNVSPKTAKTPIKPKRGLSEVDKLLMDEGAVKMLYDLKTPDDSPVTRKKKDFISVEKAEKDLIKKAIQLKSDLVQNTSQGESPKTLRKKEGPFVISPPMKPAVALERKMSRDSTRSSVHTPPRSPTFQFSSHSQASMLIRRRSSSSISTDEEIDVDFVPKVAKKTKKSKRNVFEESKEPAKEEKVMEKVKHVKEYPGKSPQKLPKSGHPYTTFSIRKTGKQVVIDLHYLDDKCYFTTQVLEELTIALKKCGKDKDVKIVSLISTNKAFCLGIDYSSLVSSDEKERLEKAIALADKVKDFLLCLLHFPKVLMAGIQSDCVGLGVTMLPLFDMVIASDKATFSTIGLATELFYAGQTLNADEALRRGLISKLCWPEKYKDALKNVLLAVSVGSKQSLEATKKQLRSRMLKETEAAIKADKEMLIEHWTSAECQENFAKLYKKVLRKYLNKSKESTTNTVYIKGNKLIVDNIGYTIEELESQVEEDEDAEKKPSSAPQTLVVNRSDKYELAPKLQTKTNSSLDPEKLTPEKDTSKS